MFRVELPAPDDASDASGDRGRRVVCASARGARAGDLLLRAPSFAALLDPSLWAAHCHACFRGADASAPDPTALSRCGRCRVAHYCSRACQQRDWKPDHAVECAKLAQLTALKLRGDQLSDVLLLGRVVRRVAADAKRSGPQGAEGDEHDLVSPLRLMWSEEDCTQETELLAVLAQKLGVVAGESTTTSVRHLQRLLSRFRNNNFAVCDARLVPVGAGCFPLAAMVNHSCAPNAVITFDEATHAVAFRALQPIADGEEITHAYVEMALPRRERQKRLRQRYHFTCSCARCLDDQSPDRYLAADVDGVDEAHWTPARQEQAAESAALLERALEPEISITREARLELMTKALAMQDTALHTDNVQRLATLSQLFTLQLQDPNDWQEAVRTGDRIQGVYERVYPEIHPLVALHLFTLGDLCATQPDQQAAARKYLTDAKSMLRVTHGESHAFVRMIEQRLAELEMR